MPSKNKIPLFLRLISNTFVSDFSLVSKTLTFSLRMNRLDSEPGQLSNGWISCSLPRLIHYLASIKASIIPHF